MPRKTAGTDPRDNNQIRYALGQSNGLPATLRPAVTALLGGHVWRFLYDGHLSLGQ